MRKPIFWKIFLAVLSLSFATVGAVFFIGSAYVRSLIAGYNEEKLDSQIYLMTSAVRSSLRTGNSQELNQLFEDWQKKNSFRYTFVDIFGDCIADSRFHCRDLDRMIDRPEIQNAFQEVTKAVTRYSYSSKEVMTFKTKRIVIDEKVVGVLRVGIPVNTSDQSLKSFYRDFIYTSCLLLLATILISWWLSRRISKPLEVLTWQAQQMADNDFTSRIKLSRNVSHELFALAEAMNKLSTKLADRFKQILRQKNEQEALLSSMQEGVLAISKELNIIHINEVAKKILDIETQEAAGTSIYESIRNDEIQKFILSAVKTETVSQTEILIPGEPPKYVQFTASTLRSASGKNGGSVIVFSDLSSFYILDKKRRDFVANVSHELKTPLTLIQGFAETMLNPKLQDVAEFKKFSEIIFKHAQRLQLIIDDLLVLSSLEAEGDSENIERIIQNIAKSVHTAMELCSERAKAKNISLIANLDENLSMPMHSQLFEQALVNIIDNGIKYSDEGKNIHIDLKLHQNNIELRIVDQGLGIPEKYIGRIFERFYRADKGRSRKAGGTGLGLSIVKHVVKVHKGRIDLRSQESVGTEFLLRFPVS